MQLAICLSVVFVITMFATIDQVVIYNRLPYANEQAAEIKSKQIIFEKIERVNTDVQIIQLTNQVEHLKNEVEQLNLAFQLTQITGLYAQASEKY